MRKRVFTAIGLVLIGIPAVLLGGFFYFLFLGVFITGAAVEYVQMFRTAKLEPNMVITAGGVFALLAVRMIWPGMTMLLFACLVLAAMTYHLIAFERGREQAAFDFGVSAAGLAYLGWVGGYLLDLRNLPNGAWWFMLVMPCVWMADAGAYSIGAAYGRHKMTPRLSPKKSWEGYAAGVFTGALEGAFFVFAYSTWGPLNGHITILQGAVLGFLLGAITPLGDLGESMFKRQSGLKDSSEVFPGHGGFFDRIDTWLWAGIIGYYFILWFAK